MAYLVCVIMGLLNFALFKIPYLARFWKYRGIKEMARISGYELMKNSTYLGLGAWRWYYDGHMSIILMKVIFGLGILLLVLGIIGILTAKTSFGKTGKVLARTGLVFMMIFHVALLVFLIMVCIRWKLQAYGGYQLSAGIFVSLILWAAALACSYVQESRVATEEVIDETAIYEDKERFALDEENNNKKLARFLLTFLLGWIGSVVINHSVLKPRGYVSRSWAYFWFAILTLGLYPTIASIFNWTFNPYYERNIGYKRES